MKRNYLKKSALLIIALVIPTSNLFAFTWEDLWLRKDQQAEEAMNAGKLKKAAKLFENKNWQGVANYRAGDYEAALKNFQQNDSAVGYYNQGNALAQMGDYHKAIDAYNKALAKNPKMADAKFNKELLEKLKDQQDKNKKSNPQNDQSTDNGKNNQDQSSQSKDQSDQNKQNNNNQQQNSQGQQKNNQQQNKKSKSNQNQNSQDQQNQSQQADNKQQPGKQGKDKQNAQHLTEQQQATEQWLRGIPDNPGGLLKQKFLRDHQEYQAQSQQGKSSW